MDDELREYALEVCRDSNKDFTGVDDPELVERLVKFVTAEHLGNVENEWDDRGELLVSGMTPTHILLQPKFISGGPGYLGKVYHLFYDGWPGAYVSVGENSEGFFMASSAKEWQG